MKKQAEEIELKKKEEQEIQFEKDVNLLMKLGFDEQLARIAVATHPYSAQEAINYALNARKS